MYLFILIPTPHDSPGALNQIPRPPRCLQIVRRNKPVLHVGPSAHLLRAANQDTHLPAAYFCEQLFFLDVCFGFVYKDNLLRLHTASNELFADIVIHVYETCSFFGCACRRRGNVTENQLCKLFRIAFTPVFQHVCDTHINLRAWLVREQWVDDTLVKPQLASVGRYL